MITGCADSGFGAPRGVGIAAAVIRRFDRLVAFDVHAMRNEEVIAAAGPQAPPNLAPEVRNLIMG